MIVVYHNPDCGTSRNTLRLIEASGEELTVIDYLKEGWTRAQLLGLFAASGLTPRTALRVSKSPAEDLGLTDPSVPDDALLQAMVANPLLVNRPIVCSAKGVRLCRPSTEVLPLLAQMPKTPVFDEKGEVLFQPEPRR